MPLSLGTDRRFTAVACGAAAVSSAPLLASLGVQSSARPKHSVHFKRIMA